ncbi:MAG: hypothetical protein LC749_12380 [Actinobacteria bacterium]|nr:hypothetical protein [Actinomycetota bacterium]
MPASPPSTTLGRPLAASVAGEPDRRPRPENDYGYIDKAFKSADDYYTAANEPPAIGTWREDLSDAQAAIVRWINVAVGWQINNSTDHDLAVAAASVTTALDKARSDVAAVLAAS